MAGRNRRQLVGLALIATLAVAAHGQEIVGLYTEVDAPDEPRAVLVESDGETFSFSFLGREERMAFPCSPIGDGRHVCGDRVMVERRGMTLNANVMGQEHTMEFLTADPAGGYQLFRSGEGHFVMIAALVGDGAELSVDITEWYLYFVEKAELVGTGTYLVDTPDGELTMAFQGASLEVSQRGANMLRLRRAEYPSSAR